MISDYAPKEKGLKALKEGKKTYTYDEISEMYKKLQYEKSIEELQELQKSLNLLGNEKNKLLGDIEALAPWIELDAGQEDIESLKMSSVEIGTMPLKNVENLETALEEEIGDYYIEKISETNNEARLLIAYRSIHNEKLAEMLLSNGFTKVNVQFRSKPLMQSEDYIRRVDEIDKEVLMTEEKIAEYKNVEEDLKVAYEFLSAEKNKVQNCSNFSKSDKSVMMEGWVDAENLKDFENAVENICSGYYHLETKEADQEENIPIKLKGNKFTETFHSITEMYSLPNYKEVDPTPILSVFYLIFFGMMLSDLGYGLIMVLGTVFALKSFKLNDGAQKFMKLFFYLGISTVVWGTVYGSFFGNILTSEYLGNTGWLNYFNKPMLNTTTDVMTILIISIAFGVVHIYAGLFMKAYVLFRDKKYMDIIYDVVTWYAALTGIALWIGAGSIGISPNIGMVMSIAGLGGLVLTQGREADTLGGKIGGGVYGLYGITGYIGDIVSYSRLMALGLATGSISMAFNSIIALVANSGLIFVLKLLLVLVLFSALHLFNFGINALGTYVHTSRLQYLEFFSKFYDGGGKKFNPLAAEKKYFEINKK